MKLKSKTTKQILNLGHRYLQQLEDLQRTTDLAMKRYNQITTENEDLKNQMAMVSHQNAELVNKVIELNQTITAKDDQIKSLMAIKVKEYGESY